MSKRELKIAACPFCGGGGGIYRFKPGNIETANVYCDCGYRSKTYFTASEAIRAHNELCSRIPRAKLLQVMGGMKGAAEKGRERCGRMNLPIQYREYLSEIIVLNAAMDKIRAMAKESSK